MKNILIIIALCGSFQAIGQTKSTHNHAKMKASFEKKTTAAHVQNEPLKEDGIDPICKMKVRKGEKLTTTYKGKQIGFCGDYCKEKFEENPEKFIKQ